MNYLAKKYTQKKIDVSGHKRSDPRINKKVDVRPYKREQSFKQYKNITEKTFLENIKLPKKDKTTMDRVKAGFFEKNITEAEKKIFDQPIKLQMDIYNQPTKDAYQKQLNRTMKQIVKVSGIGEIRERLRILQKSKLVLFDDFESSLKSLNDERKEIELKIRNLKKSGERDVQLENKKQIIIDSIKNSPEKKIYKNKIKLMDKRIDKYQKEIERFYFNFLDEVNNELLPIKTKKGYSELYLDDNLFFVAQEKKEHKVQIDGKEHIANLKAYKFEELDSNLKENILKIINKNFKKEYLKDESDQFLKAFKDKPEKQVKKGEQVNLDKLIGINTKLYDEYGDMKAFGKSQTRLDKVLKNVSPKDRKIILEEIGKIGKKEVEKQITKPETEIYDHIEYERARMDVITIKDFIKEDTIDRDKAIRIGESKERIKFLDDKLGDKHILLLKAIEKRNRINKLPRGSIADIIAKNKADKKNRG